MKPIDFARASFEGLRHELEGLRRQAYEAWVVHGPGTTREVAQACGMDLLTFRPRTTELVELGLVELVPDQESGKEGIYRATPQERWETWAEEMGKGQMVLF